jgi:Na+-transporting NADH:ubiquinone oxidoreductase subunit NqrB
MAGREQTNMKPWQIVVFGYGLLYFLLACAMEAENLQQSYPLVYVVFSMIAQTLVVGGIFVFGLEAGPEFARVWRWLFPLLIVEAAVGVVFDATIPVDFNLRSNGTEWIASVLFGLWIASPAYYFNFRIARYGG